MDLSYFVKNYERNKRDFVEIAKQHSSDMQDLTEEEILGLAMDYLVTEKGFNSFLADAEKQIASRK